MFIFSRRGRRFGNSNTMKSLAKKMGITIRISAYSERKGSATDAPLNRVPLIAIKPWENSIISR